MAHLYLNALDEWRNWETTPAQWLLITGTILAITDAQVWVSDIAAHETVVPSYTRQVVTGQTRTIDTLSLRIVYDCDDPVWGTLDTTTPPTIVGAMLAYTGADDASSLLLAYYDLDVSGGGPVNPIVSSTGVHWVAQG